MVSNITIHEIRPRTPEPRVVDSPPPEPRDTAPRVDPPASGTSVDKPELMAVLSAIEQDTSGQQRSLQFSVDEASGHTVITVYDRETGEVIRQIPPEETLAIAARVKAGNGVLLTDRA